MLVQRNIYIFGNFECLKTFRFEIKNAWQSEKFVQMLQKNQNNKIIAP